MLIFIEFYSITFYWQWVIIDAVVINLTRSIRIVIQSHNYTNHMVPTCPEHFQIVKYNFFPFGFPICWTFVSMFWMSYIDLYWLVHEKYGYFCYHKQEPEPSTCHQYINIHNFMSANTEDQFYHHKRNTISEMKMLLFWQHFHHWLQWKLSKWQLPLQPVMKIISKWHSLYVTAPCII